MSHSGFDGDRPLRMLFRRPAVETRLGFDRTGSRFSLKRLWSHRVRSLIGPLPSRDMPWMMAGAPEGGRMEQMETATIKPPPPLSRYLSRQRQGT